MCESPIRSQREILSRPEIEERVGRMLDYVLPDRGDDPTPPDLQRVVTVLESQYGVRFSFSEELGRLPTGKRIFGTFAVAPLTIRVTSLLPKWSPGFQRTLAHELGHLALHRKMLGKGRYISREKPIVDTARQLRYQETAELSDLGWVEWQANEFAMCLILPRRYLQVLVCSVQIEFGIRRNLGTMYLDDQPCNKRDCHRVVEEIARRSGAKIPLLWRRLRFSGILEDHQKKRTRPVFEALDTLFETDDQAEHRDVVTPSPQQELDRHDNGNPEE